MRRLSVGSDCQIVQRMEMKFTDWLIEGKDPERELEKARQREQDGVNAATVNKEASLVKCMLFRAVEWDIIDRNTLQGMRLFKEPEKRRVNLTPEQAGKLVDELPDPVSNIAEFAI